MEKKRASCPPHCTCARHKGANDLAGRRFGRLAAIQDVGSNKFRKRLWECQCDCGKVLTIPSSNLLSGNTKSCGCYKLDSIIEIGHRNLGRPADPSLNHEAFYKVTEEAAAYWVGFLMADGYINRRKKGNPDVALCLALRDIGHVNKFKAFLGSSRKVTTSKGKYPTAIFSVSSNTLVAQLERLGVTPHKTLTAKVSDELLFNPHFWRGMIDGDGSFYFSKKVKLGLSLIGSKSMCQQFLLFTRRLGYGNGVSIYPQKTKGIFTTGLNGREAVSTAAVLYSNATVFLDRKQATFTQRVVPLLAWSYAPKHSMIWTAAMRAAQSKRMQGNQLWKYRKAA